MWWIQSFFREVIWCGLLLTPAVTFVQGENQQAFPYVILTRNLQEVPRA